MRQRRDTSRGRLRSLSGDRVFFLLIAPLSFAGIFEEIVIEVEIRAPPEIVWEVITDFEAYSEWNPWITEASGEAVEGARVNVVSLLQGEPRGVSHRVTVVEPYEAFCWQDLGVFTLLAKGWRCRTLEAVGWKTQYRMELQVLGPLSGMVDRQYGESIREGAEAEARALSERAESLANER